VLDCNRQLREWKLPPVVSYRALCREIAGMSFGELDSVGARSVIRRYSTEWFEAAKRRKAGQPGGFPPQEGPALGALVPGDLPHRRRPPHGSGGPGSPAAGGKPGEGSSLPSRVHPLAHPAGGGGGPEDHDLDPGIVAGVDPGIIHPFAVVAGDEALLVSGRGLRSECHLHLADTKARARSMGRKAPTRGQRGSRRWRRLRRAQRRQEARHRRRIRQGHHEAAKAVVAWAVDHRVGTLRVGDPEGICKRDAGRRQNLRLRNWGRTHLIGALKDKAAMAGIEVVEVDERGTSSTCLACRKRVPKPRGRAFRCSSCGFSGHRDLVGAANIAARGGGVICGSPRIEHRRVGDVPARRDRRRHCHDVRRSCLAHGRRGSQGSRSRSPTGAERRARPSVSRTHAGTPAISEEPLAGVYLEEGKG
jgi:putative transposase